MLLSLKVPLFTSIAFKPDYKWCLTVDWNHSQRFFFSKKSWGGRGCKDWDPRQELIYTEYNSPWRVKPRASRSQLYFACALLLNQFTACLLHEKWHVAASLILSQLLVHCAVLQPQEALWKKMKTKKMSWVRVQAEANCSDLLFTNEMLD